MDIVSVTENFRPHVRVVLNEKERYLCDIKYCLRIYERMKLAIFEFNRRAREIKTFLNDVE